MGKTFRHEPNPERVRRVQEMRRSSIADPVDRDKGRKADRLDAIEESWEDYDYLMNDDRTEEVYDEGYDDYPE